MNVQLLQKAADMKAEQMQVVARLAENLFASRNAATAFVKLAKILQAAQVTAKNYAVNIDRRNARSMIIAISQEEAERTGRDALRNQQEHKLEVAMAVLKNYLFLIFLFKTS